MSAGAVSGPIIANKPELLSILSDARYFRPSSPSTVGRRTRRRRRILREGRSEEGPHISRRNEVNFKAPSCILSRHGMASGRRRSAAIKGAKTTARRSVPPRSSAARWSSSPRRSFSFLLRRASGGGGRPAIIGLHVRDCGVRVHDRDGPR